MQVLNTNMAQESNLYYKNTSISTQNAKKRKFARAQTNCKHFNEFYAHLVYFIKLTT